MGKRVTTRHNKDGSITKTTTYSRKTVLGNRKTESFTERIPAKGGKSKGIPWWVWVIIILIVIGAIVKK